MTNRLRVVLPDGAIHDEPLPGRPLRPRLPESIPVRRIGGLLQIDLTAPINDVGERFCGRLVVLAHDTRERALRQVGVDVPPPSPWTPVHLSALYEAAVRLDTEAASVARAGRQPWRRLVRRPHEHVDPELLEDLRRAAGEWLTDRTRAESVQLVERPTELSGGREDAVETMRRLGRTIPTRPADGQPARTVRRVASSRRWTSPSTAGLLQRVLQELADDDLQAWLLLPIRRAATSLQAAATPEPPLSSWPIALARLRAAALQLLTTLGERAPAGTDWMPLTNLWLLYELWLADHVAEQLTYLLGKPTLEVRLSTITWSWDTRPGEVTLAYQQEIGPSPEPPHYLRSVTCRLRPDLLLTVRSRHGSRSSAVLDAKHRPIMSPDEVGSEASKYLWSLRSGGSPEVVPGLHVVWLVSHSGRGPSYLPARIRLTGAAPRPNSIGLSPSLAPEALLKLLRELGWQ